MANKTKNQPIKKAQSITTDTPNRTRKLNRKDAKKQAKKTVATKPRLAGGFMLIKKCLQFCSKNARLLVLINLVYLTFHVFLVRGLGGPMDITEIRANLEEVFDSPSQTVTAVSIFGYLLTNGTSGSDAMLQLIMFILISLVLIWTMRQLFSGALVSLKQAYYNSTGQLVPFLITAAWVVVQLLPVTIGTVLLQFAVYGGLTSNLELFGIVLAFLLLLGWSVYLVTASLFALYIVTLPEMTPLAALRSAKQLVRYRRLKIQSRLVVLPIALLTVYAVVVLPLILYVPFLAEPVFYVLSIVSVAFSHIYIYHLYRELLK